MSRTPSPTADFGDHVVYLVGFEIAPGTWRNTDSANGCYWERRSGSEIPPNEVIANGFSFDIQTVELEPSDRGFYSENCGSWTRVE